MAEPQPSPLPIASDGSAGLLVTKLHVPQLPSTFVARGRLLDRLADRQTGGALTSVCAPAGFGKSVVVAHWLAERGEPAAWLSLDAGDNDLIRFWRHVAASLDGTVRGAAGSMLDELDDMVRAGQSSPEALVAAVINSMAPRTDGVLLVLEDYHLITAEAVHRSVRYLLDHAPRSLRVVVISRTDPPLQLARRRGIGELTEIREADLRFTSDEAARLLSAATGSDLPAGAAPKLATRTEGWAVGLQLAGLSLRGRVDAAEFVETFSGSHRFVLDYLTEEVLEHQSEEVSDFLLRTSILDRLSAPLCDAVTGRSDGQAMLEAIEHANLFLVPLDGQRRWWRYHHLFADLLRVRLSRLPEAEVRALHSRAARWHDEHGPVSEAVRHAVAAEEPDRAAGIIERHADEVLLRREGTVLQQWFAQLPASQLGSRRLRLAEARVALYRGQLGEAEALLDAADQVDVDPHSRFEPSVNATASPLAALDPMAALLRAFVAHLRGDDVDSSALATEVLAEVPDQRSVLALIAQLHLATAPWLRGEAEDARRALAVNIADWRAAGQPDRAAWCSHYLGAIQRSQGDLDGAAETYRDVLELDVDRAGPGSAVAGVAHVGLASVAYQRNDLAAARQHAEEGIDWCRDFVYTQALATGLSTLARINQAETDAAGALALTDEAMQVGPTTEVVDLLNPVPTQRAQILLMQGETDSVAEWATQRGLSAGDDLAHVRTPAYMVFARLLTAVGRSDDALAILGKLGKAAAAQSRIGDLVEIEALRALALAAVGESARALDALTHTVKLAEPQSHVRVFIDEGRPMADLLRDLIADGPAHRELPLGFVARLRDSFGGGTDSSATGSEAPGELVVPLSSRELEVLRLVATGKQNKEIADELYVSLNTVKKHVTHILDKLGAANRTSAAERARELGLLN